MTELKKGFEEDDPYAFVGIGFAVPEDIDAAGEMARTIIEEYALMGYTYADILSMFLNPSFLGPYSIFQSRGAEYVKQMIEEIVPREEREAARTLGENNAPGL